MTTHNRNHITQKYGLNASQRTSESVNESQWLAGKVGRGLAAFRAERLCLSEFYSIFRGYASAAIPIDLIEVYK
jgi:hypothetical protein